AVDRHAVGERNDALDARGRTVQRPELEPDRLRRIVPGLGQARLVARRFAVARHDDALVEADEAARPGADRRSWHEALGHRRTRAGLLAGRLDQEGQALRLDPRGELRPYPLQQFGGFAAGHLRDIAFAHALERGPGLGRPLARERDLVAQFEVGALQSLQIRLELLGARLVRGYADLVAVEADPEHGEGAE